MPVGIVKKYIAKRGFGWIFPLGCKRDADLIYFHISQVRGETTVPLGAEVRFQKINAPKGVTAARIELLEFGGQRTLAEAARQDELEARKKARSEGVNQL